NLISGMPRYNVMTLIFARHRFLNDQAFAREVRERVEILDSCKLTEVQVHRKKMIKLATLTLLWNSLGWVIYIIPVGFAVVMYQQTQRAVRALLTLSESALENISEDCSGGLNSRLA
ncbi:MAG: hypothetical protein V4772_23520, partial [Pseudomonadota bacterium]